ARAAGDEASEEAREVGEHSRGGRIEGLARGAQHRTVEADLDEGDMVGGDLHADRGAAALRESEAPRGPPARWLVVELDDETVDEQLLGELRHERGRDPEHAGQFGARGGTVGTEVR